MIFLIYIRKAEQDSHDGQHCRQDIHSAQPNLPRRYTNNLMVIQETLLCASLHGFSFWLQNAMYRRLIAIWFTIFILLSIG